MKETKKPDLSAIMADYTQQVIAENRRRQAIRDAAAAGSTEILTPAPESGQWGIWNISDRD
jgi:hypothetical protein